MGLFDDLQKKTRTPQDYAQSQKEAQEQKRINALNEKVDYIKKSVYEETKIAASKGVRTLIIEPYYFFDSYDYDLVQRKFYKEPPYDHIIVKGHMYKTSKHSPWYDFYGVDALRDGHGYYGYILPQDRPYIITKVEEFLRAEGFKDFYVKFGKEYLKPNAIIFKSPTGRNVLRIYLSW